jgi:hypothetical protein
MRICFVVAFVGLVDAVVGQGGFTAQWTALSPIVAQWTNAPGGTPGAIVTWPAGPLPNTPIVVAVNVPAWPNAAQFGSTPLPLQTGMLSNWSFSADSWEPFGLHVQTTADLLLQVTGPAAATGSIEFVVTSMGDSPSAAAFRVDVGNDGTFELDSSVSGLFPTTSLDRHGAYAWDFGGGPLFVRVQHLADGFTAPQLFGLQVSFRPWVDVAESFGDDCGSQGTVMGVGNYFSHYHLAALPPLGPLDLAALRATGIGPFSGFLVSTQANTVLFHLPGSLSSPCDLLASAFFTASGAASRVVQFPVLLLPVEWVVVVPSLPPGLEFWVQHASMQLPYLGFTNRVRIRT